MTPWSRQIMHQLSTLPETSQTGETKSAGRQVAVNKVAVEDYGPNMRPIRNEFLFYNRASLVLHTADRERYY